MTELYDIRAEQVVLGTLLTSAKTHGFLHQLKPEQFALAEHQQIYARITAEIDAGRVPSPAAFAALFAPLTVAGKKGAEYILTLAGRSDPDMLPGCVAAVREMAFRRELNVLGMDILSASRDPNVIISHALADASKRLDAITAVNSMRRKSAVMVGDALQALLDDLEKAGNDNLIRSGWRDLDAKLGGFPRQEMTIVAGRPSMGKSAVLFAIARNVAEQGHGVIVFSLEMAAQAVSARILSDLAYQGVSHSQNLPYSALLRGEHSAAQNGRIRELREMLDDYPLLIDDQGGLTMTEITLRSRQFADALLKKGKRLGMVIIDHLGKVQASDRYRGNLVHETGEKSNASTILAKELDVASVVAQQLNRGTEGRDDKQPGMADLRDSGNLEQDAHTIIFPWRAAYYLERKKGKNDAEEEARKKALDEVRNKIDIIIAKCRNGETGVVELFADMGNNHFSNLATQLSNVR